MLFRDHLVKQQFQFSKEDELPIDRANSGEENKPLQFSKSSQRVGLIFWSENTLGGFNSGICQVTQIQFRKNHFPPYFFLLLYHILGGAVLYEYDINNIPKQLNNSDLICDVCTVLYVVLCTYVYWQIFRLNDIIG